MLLIKCRLKGLIALDSNQYITDQIFINSFQRNTRPSICFKTQDRAFRTLGRAFQTLGRFFQALGRAFEALIENQKLGRKFERLGQVIEKLGRVFKKLGRVFVLQHGPRFPNQPRYCIVLKVIN